MKKIYKKMSKKQDDPSAFFTFFIFAFSWINCKKMQKNAKKWHFVIFSRFSKRVQRIHPRVFAVKGGSHPGKNPPIYTVLNAAFSCVKTPCRGLSADSCTTPERQFFSEKKFSTPPNFVLTKF